MSTAYRVLTGIRTQEQRHIERVMRLSCAACYRRGLFTPAQEFHHIRTGVGGAQRSSDFLGVPLCWPCHQGSDGIHGAGTKGFVSINAFSELDLLADTFMRVSLCLESGG